MQRSAPQLGKNIEMVQRPPLQALAKVPLQTSESGYEWHGEGVEPAFRAFLQQSPLVLDPKR